MNKIVVITPVFNDWPCFNQLVQTIEKEANDYQFAVEIIAVNDYSTSISDSKIISSSLKIKRINLSHNVGHQRAICIGLCHVNQSEQDFEAVVVMDSDGEDNPVDIAKLLEKAKETNFEKIIFARRKKAKRKPRLFGFLFFLSHFVQIDDRKTNQFWQF